MSGAQKKAAADPCRRPAAGSVVREPVDLHSRNGVLKVNLTVRDFIEPGCSTRYCYLDEHGDESPTLRVGNGSIRRIIDR